MTNEREERRMEFMTILEAIENVLRFIESLGYLNGDIHDDLVLAISRLKWGAKVEKEL